MGGLSEREDGAMHGMTEPTREAPAPLPASSSGRRWRVNSRWLWQAALGGVLLLALLAELAWWGLSATATNYPGWHFNRGQNATWLAHTWVGAAHTSGDYDALAALLQREQITYVYAHVGPLTGAGTIPPARYPAAGAFAQAMHARLPELRILAWIGQIYAPGAPPGSTAVDLARSQTRANIAATAALFTSRLGFDGVHYDIEPVPNNDPHFLDLLDTTRAQIGPGKILSLSTPNWVPVARVTNIIQSLRDQPNVWWTTYYYQAVSRHVDQIVAMMYNTGMPTAPLYETIVQQETAHILRSVALTAPHTQVLIGIPTYTDPPSRAFHASAENMRTGLHGVIAGLNEDDGLSAFTGLAIYPEWLTTGDDWALYRQDWLGA
jgi:hypothetical protein